jgi:hypothetical protein
MFVPVQPPYFLGIGGSSFMEAIAELVTEIAGDASSTPNCC